MKLLLYVGLLCITTLPGVTKEKNQKEVVAMRCVHTNWGVVIDRRESPRTFLMRPRTVHDSLITYQIGYLQTLQSQIEHLQQAPDTAYVDVRTVCLLETNKGTIDTLSLGGFKYCQYNGKYYYLTWEIFQTVMKKLPRDEDIEWWLQDDPTIKEQMIENGKR